MKEFFRLIIILVFALCINISLFAADPSDVKLSVAILNFEAAKGFDSQDALTLTQKFTYALMQTQKFDIMSRAQMDKVKEEKKIQYSEDFNANTAVKIGEALGVPNVVIGHVGRIGDTFTITVNMVEVSTLKIQRMASIDFTGKIDQALPAMKNLAAQIAQIELREEQKEEIKIEQQQKTKLKPIEQTYDEPPKTPQGYKPNISGKIYTAFNIWYEKPDNILMINYKLGTMIPAGTEVTNVRIEQQGRINNLVFKIAGTGTDFKIVQDKYNKNLSLEEFKRKFITYKNFDELTSGLSAKDIDNIRAGKIEIGMSRESVIISYGYPPLHRTPSIDTPKWTYYNKGSRDEVLISFNSNWQISEIRH